MHGAAHLRVLQRTLRGAPRLLLVQALEEVPLGPVLSHLVLPVREGRLVSLCSVSTLSPLQNI